MDGHGEALGAFLEVGRHMEDGQYVRRCMVVLRMCAIPASCSAVVSLDDYTRCFEWRRSRSANIEARLTLFSLEPADRLWPLLLPLPTAS